MLLLAVLMAALALGLLHLAFKPGLFIDRELPFWLALCIGIVTLLAVFAGLRIASAGDLFSPAWAAAASLIAMPLALGLRNSLRRVPAYMIAVLFIGLMLAAVWDSTWNVHGLIPAGQWMAVAVGGALPTVSFRVVAEFVRLRDFARLRLDADQRAGRSRE